LERLRLLGKRHQLVFTMPTGEPFTTATLRTRMRNVCKRAGISTDGRTTYTLRRSHATLALLAHEPLKSLSEQMGHVSVEFTQDEYIDTLQEMEQIAADRLEQMLLRTYLAQTELAQIM
jgi:integrase